MSKFTKSQGLWLTIIIGVTSSVSFGSGVFISIGLGLLALCIYTYKSWNK